jgi:hypothetical protein
MSPVSAGRSINRAILARRNIQAQAFWRRAAGGRPAVRDVEESDMTSAAWNGPIIRFRSGV